DAFVILDEAQNATAMQMKMFLTRLGVNSQIVITGDKTQIDLPKREESGLMQVERILPGIEGIAFHYFTDVDVVRHRLVRDIIKASAEDGECAREAAARARAGGRHSGDSAPTSRCGAGAARVPAHRPVGDHHGRARRPTANTC